MSAFGQRTPARRRVGTRKTHTRVLVICGGVETEPRYLRYVGDRLGASGVKIETVPDGRDLTSLVRMARDRREAERKQAAATNDARNTYDAVWVMADVDDYGAQVLGALQEAIRAGVEVALSNPCFELWLL